MLGSLSSGEYLWMVTPGWNSSHLHLKAPISIISQKKFLSWANPNNSPEKTTCSFHESFNQFFLKIIYHNIARGKVQITVSKKWNNLLKFSDKWSNFRSLLKDVYLYLYVFSNCDEIHDDMWILLYSLKVLKVLKENLSGCF